MMDNTGQSADDQCSAEAERRHQHREFREFAELSPTERCLALLNFTALFAAVLHFVVRLTGLGAAVPVDDNNNNKPEDKTHSSSLVTGGDLFQLVLINAITVTGVISLLSSRLVWLAAHLLLLLAYSAALSITLAFFEPAPKTVVLLSLATIYLVVFVCFLRSAQQHYSSSSSSSSSSKVLPRG
ncbi:hypothetical protein TYRP_010424 [Tyrophagus putrescentiae]|nr:hypothetical protein TYRP_010424 [Tyrophagus putrescentiae]